MHFELSQQLQGFLQSHLLWDDFNFGLQQFDFKSINNISYDTIHSIHVGDNEVLGKRVEHFFEYCIENSDIYTLLAKNLQVFKEKITIGELDFIIKDLNKDTIIHVELIFKFYVYDHTISNELERWIGPNRKDSLLQKIEKLKTKQLPLLYKEETFPILEHLNIDPKYIDQKVCYMANLFVHLSLQNSSIPIVNTNCIIGFWIHKHEFHREAYSSFVFCIPEKKYWLVNPNQCTTWFSFEDIEEKIQSFLSKKRSPMVWIKRNEDQYERFFIVWW
ncbi:DUF1853 family protein [Aquimarina algicola]|uniref:DUF1853 family protein n=1 Tax=Aquimarina algicola TaxID=2589995 RepID=A0A504JE39_9FLAO|nr:DUF1853 family protein [Aquimarina algicola]TPN85129.1 DUF1853 family protein [Aquimarina algicola]